MKKQINFLQLILLLLLVISCETDSQYEKISGKQQEISEKIQPLFDHSEFIVNEDTILIDKNFKDFYEKRSFIPLWINEKGITREAKSVVNLLLDSRLYGLPEEFYLGKTLASLEKSNLPLYEVTLTYMLSLFLEHHHHGLLNEEKTALKENAFQQKFIPTIENLAEKGVQWDYLPTQNGGDPADRLINAWQNYVYALMTELNDTLISPPNFKEDSLLAYKFAFNNLHLLGWIDSTHQSDSLKLEQFKKYQNLHGLKADGLIGKYSQKILTRTHEDRFRQFVLAVEKWKWKKDSLKGSYIYVNIPEFRLYYYRNDSLKAVHKVIVGAPVTKTPEFTAKMTTIVTYPFWHVPHSIASTEIVAGARRDSNYFSKKGYVVEDRNKNVMNPDSIDWSKYHENYFPFRVKQDKGRTNSLGIIKFLFPNEHMVYIHDTPGKYLFVNDVRAYSHGCIRLQDPIDFAKVLIEDQGFENFNGDSLKARLDSSFQRVISLKKSKPVVIDYISTTVHPESDSLQFHIDIYGRDEKFINMIFE